MLARRQQRAGQRERQREDRVAEAHERQIGDQATSSWRSRQTQWRCGPATRRPRRRQPTRCSSTILQTVRTATPPPDLGALAGRERCRSGDPGPARARRPASRSRADPAGRHAGREPPHRLQLREQVQVGRRCARLSVPTATGTPDAIEPLDRRRADTDPVVAARAGHQRRAALAEPRELPSRELHAVHDQRPRVDHAEVDPGTRPGPARAPPSPRATRRCAAAAAPMGRCRAPATPPPPATRRRART